MAVTNSVAATAAPGGIATYTITITNNGPATASNVALADAFPSGLTVLSQTQVSGLGLTLTNTSAQISDTIASMPSGASAVIQVQVQVAAGETIGTVLSDTANVSTSSVDPVSTNNSATAATTVETNVADVAVANSAAALVNTGSNVTYTITVTNNGPNAAQSVSLTDVFPSGTTFVSQSQASGPAFSLSNSATKITDTLASLPSGQSATFQLVLNVTAAAGSTLNDAANVSTTTFDPNLTNNSASTTTVIGPLSADLKVATSVPSTVLAGQNLVYTVTLTNLGPTLSQNVSLADTIPTGTTLVSQTQTNGPTFTLGSSGSTLTDTIASFANGATATFQIVVAVPSTTSSGTSLSETASVTATTADPVSSNNTASASSTVNTSADLSIDKFAPELVTDDATITTGTSTGHGAATLTDSNATWTAGQFVGCKIEITSGTGAGQVRTISANTTTQVTVSANWTTQPPNGSTFAILPATMGGTSSGSNTATTLNDTTQAWTVNQWAGDAVQIVSGTGSGQVLPITSNTATGLTLSGSWTTTPNATSVYQILVPSFNYTIWLYNNGPSNAQTVSLTDTISAPMTFVSQKQILGPAFTLSNNGNTITDTMSTLAPGQLALPAYLTGTSSGSNSTTTFNDTTQNWPTNEWQGRAIEITGGTGSGQIEEIASNTATQLVLINSWTTTPDATSTYEILPMSQYPVAEFQIGVFVPSGTALQTDLPNSASVTSATSDPITTNNSGAVQTVVTSGADVAVANTVSPNPVAPGGNVVYTITVTNNGPAVASNVTLSDLFPSNTTFVSQTQTSGTAFTLSNSGNQLTDTLATMNPSTSATFQVTVTVNSGGTAPFSDTATVGSTTVDLNLANNSATATDTVSPWATNDSYSVNDGSSLTVGAASGVLANDVGTGLTVKGVVANPGHGSVTLNSDGSFTYTPNAGFSGTDTFTYNDKDSGGNTSNTATVTITVNPTAVNDSYATSINTALTETAAIGLLKNDQGSGLTVQSVLAGPSNGTLNWNANGSFTYTPNSGFTGTDTFTYDDVDSNGTVSNSATVTISVAPTAVNDSYIASAGSPLNVAASGVLGNDLGTGLTVKGVVAGPSHGSLTLNSNGSFTYTPAADFSGTDSFAYNDSDSSGDTSNTATVTITVNPTAVNNVYTASAGSPLNVAASGVLGNDLGTGLTVKGVVAGPSHGSLTLNANGSFTYTPAAGFSGTDTFAYNDSDSSGDTSNTATVTITVNPTAVNNVYTASAGSPLNVAGSGVLGNDLGTGLTVKGVVAGPSDGSLTLNANGSFTYTPAAGFSGTDTFAYNDSDSSGDTSNTATVTITVNPTAVNDVYTASAGSPLNVAASGVLGNDLGTGLTVKGVVAGPSHGSLTLNANGSFTYTPAAGFSGTDTFAYNDSDSSGDTSNTATVTITVNPTAVNNVYTASAGSPLNVAASGVLGNDLGTGLTVKGVVAGPAHGSLTLNSNGSFAYTPAAGFSGTDSFAYNDSDSSGDTSNTATVTITVNPTAVNDVYTASAGSPLNVAASGVLGNDLGTGLTVKGVVAGPSHGSLTLNANGSFTYTPAAGFSGTDSFAYNDSDSSGDTSNTATVTITVNPTAVNDVYTASAGSPLNVAASGVLGNDLGTGLTVKGVVAGPAHGSLTLNANGSFTYTPAAGFSGTDSFTYNDSDSSGDTSNTATVSITVNPTAVNDTYTASAGSPLNVAASGVLGNDLGTGLTVKGVVAGPAHGSLTLNANGSFTYTPAAGFSGTDSFTYNDSDSSGDTSNTATVTITVNPTAVNDVYTASAGSPLNVAASGVLGNDLGTGLTVKGVVAGPAHGSLTLNANGSFAYTPAAGFSGTDSFAYNDSDSSGDTSNTATVTITVNPTAVNDVYTASAGSPLNVAASGVLGNDLGTGLTVKGVVAGPAHGSLTLNANGSFTYTPAAGFSGTDSFTYNDSDSSGDTSNTATVSITVNPTAVNDTYTASAGSPLNVAASGVLGNDLGTGLTVKGVVAGPSHGSLTLNSNGSFSYTPSAGFSGTDTFTYNDSDSSGDTSNTATVSITVNPTAVNDTYTASAGSPLNVAASGVLGNDLGTGLTVKGVVAGPAHGSLTLNANGSFTYTPAAGFSGTDTFAYNDSDSSGDTSNTATVTITVNPTAVNDVYTASAGSPLNVAASGVLGNDLGTGLTVKGVVAGPSHGSLTLNANGSFTYTPAAGFSGTDTFAYNDSDSSGDTSNTATVTITVNPTAVNDVYTASAGSPLNVAASGVLGNDLGTGLTVKGVVAGPAHGSLTLNSNGSFAYTPAAGFSGTDSFTYNDSDSSGDTSNTATVTITVNPTAVNDVYTASAGSPLNVAASGVLGNDLGTGLTVKGVVAGPAHGSLTLNSNGSFAYTPAAGFSGTDTFTYNDSDSSGDTSNTATVTITVNPTAVNDVYTASAGSPLNVAASGVLGNDLGTGLTVKGVVAGPAHGSLTLNSNGSFAYTPAAGFSGTDSFTYNDSDSSGDTSNTATVTITVNPTAVNDVYTASAGSPLNVAASGVLGNDLGTGLTVKGVVAGPAHGSLTLNANGSFAYTPAADFSGTDSFAYNDSDSSGDTSNTATVTITVNPTAVNDVYTASAGSPLNVAASGVLGNDLGTGLTVKGVVAGPAHGSLTLNSNGSFTYTPAADFSGTDSFAYNDSDSSGDTSNTATVTITVNPTAVNDVYTASAGSPLNVAASGVLGNDLGTGLTVKGVVAAPAHGSLTLNANGSFAYTPAAGFSGTDSFTYNDSDSSGDTSNTATVTITVNPTAVNDVYTASAGSPLNVAASGVLGNDLGTGLTVKGVVAGPAHGSLTLNANGSFAYTPAAGFSGTDSFTYNDSDSSGDTSNTATVTITVNPTAVNDVYTASAGSPLNVAASGVLGNDLGTGLTVKGVVAGPAHGSLTLNSNGSFAYTPAAGFSGTDSFTYNDSDSSGDTSNTATVSITVDPTAVNDVYTASAGSPLNVAASGVLGNDLGTGLTVKGVVAGPSHGSLTLNANGSFTYTPAAGFSGTDTFTYNDSDSNGDTSNTATVTITVNPTAVNNVYTASAGSPLNVAASGVLGNDLGTGLTVKGVVAGPSDGSLTLNANGSFTYTPAAGFSGTDSFAYNDSDSSGDTSNTATVTITVNPTAVNDVYTASAGSPLNVAASGVLGNDLGTGLTVKGVVAGPSHGSLTLNANGSFTYTPAAGFSGTDSFTYNDSDSSGDTSNTATVSITVNPTAVNDTYTASAGSPLNVAASGVLGNDLGTGLTVKGVVAGPSHGSLTLNANDSFTYTPAAGFSGTDTFAYNDSDSSGDTSNTATVTITVNPTAVNNVYTASAGSPLNVAASGVLGNDLGTGLTVKGVVAGPSHGSLTLNANGSFTYTPAAGFSGTDSFAYNDSDSSGDTSNTATVSITVNPTAVNDTYTASAGSPLNVAASGVLGNDLGTGLTVKGVVAGPAHGSLTLNSNGSFAYTPAAGFSGTDSFTYNDSDSSGDTSNTATVTITVNPTAVNDVYTASAGSPLNVAASGVLGNDLGTGLTVKGVVAGPSHGSLTLNSNGSFTYTPAAGFSGTDSFAYNDSDSSGDTSNTATVTITVNPTAVNDVYTASAGSPLNVAASGVLGNDLGTGLTVKGVVAGPSHGSLTLNANGSFTYTPAAGFSGTDSFAYNDSDSSGDTSNTATVTITVNPTAVNDVYTASAGSPLNVAASGVLGNDLGTGLTVKGVVAGPSDGSLTLNANGSFSYTPNVGFSGIDTFTYNDSDSSGDTSNTATVTIAVGAAAVNDSYTTAAGSLLSVSVGTGVLANDLGNGLTVKGVVAGPSHGSLILNANGSFSYTPAAGFSGIDTFTYNDTDSSGDTSNTATVTITVNPTAVNDAYTASAGSPLIVAASGVLGNDLGTGLTVKGVVAGPSHGSLTLNANGSFTYTPAAGFSGTDSFAYNDSDSSGDTSNTATVSITVDPTAVNDTYTASANGTLNVAGSGVLGNDLGTGLTVKGVVAGPSHGSLTLNSNGSFSYTPSAGFSGTDSFTYNDSDSSGDTSNTATVSITVDPTAVNDVYTASAGSPLNVAASGVLGNDLGTGLTVKGVVAGPSHGSLTLNANGSFTYTPAAGFSGTDTFTYNDSDSNGDTSNTATVTITVNPTAVNDVYTASAGSPLNVAASGVLGNDLGTGLTVKGVVAGPAHGSLTLNSNGSFAYTPAAGFSGTDSFAYNDSDSSGDTSNTATVTITVNPTAVNDVYTASAGSPLNVAASGVLGNDLGTGLTVKGVVAGPSHGSLTLNANGSFTYTPAAGFSGTDTFTYNDSDSSGDTSNTATVTITVNPTAVNDVYTASAGSPLNVAASGVLGNDLGTGLTVKGVVAGPAHGSLTLNSNGSFAYTPAAGFSGTDSFAYNDSDSSGDTSNTATVTITVNPTAVNDVYTASAGSPLNVAASGVLGNDLGTGLTVKGVVAGPGDGSLTLNANGSFTYTPAAGFSGTDTFAYNDSDSSGDTSNTATVTITVNPTAVNDVYTASAGSPLNVAASGVLGNDLGTGLTVKGVVAGPSDGSLTLNANGSFSYTPNVGFSGIDTFTYNDSDSSGDTSNTATVTIAVGAAAVNDSYTTAAGSLLSVSVGTGVLANDLGNGLTVKGVVAGPSHGSLILNANGSFSYTPAAGFSGIDTFTYNDTDSSGDTSNTATVTITVNPTAVNDAYTASAGSPLIVAASGVLGNDLGTGLTVKGVVAGPSHGSLTLNANGSFTYTPAAGFSGTDSFAYNDSDSSSDTSNTATVSITVDPTAVNDTYTASANGTLNVAGSGVLGNDLGTGLTVKGVVAGPSHGSLTLNANGSFTYTPAAGFSGTDSFAYNDSDSSGDTSNTATVTITVNPTAVNDVYTASAGSPLNVAASGVLGNDLGTGLTVKGVVAGPAHGSLTLNANGSFAYTPAAGFSGTDSFTYNDSDSSGDTSNTATVTITVNPTAVNDVYTASAGSPLNVAASGVLGNDLGTGLTVKGVVAGPSHGSLTLNANGSFTYTPAAGFSGTDSFTYNDSDSSGDTSNTATVTITVNPTAVNDVYTASAGSPLNVAASGVLGNDLGTGLTVKGVVAGPSHGSLTLNSNGSFAYTPAAGFSGTDSFAYNDSDSSGDTSNTATVTITVNPTAVNDVYTASAGSPLNVAASGVLGNDLGTGLTVKGVVAGPAHGSLTLNANGSFAYTPAAGFSGTDTFAYNDSDSSGDTSNTATVTITVNPTAVNDVYTASAGSPLNVAASGVLGNDLGTGLTVKGVVAGPSDGSLTLNANGSFTYTPAAGFSGTDTFAYNDSDSSGDTSNTATVTITVNPTAVNDVYTASAGSPLNVAASGVLGNDLGTGLTVKGVVAGPSDGSLTLNANGSFSYTPNVGFSGIDTFTYNDSDSSGDTSNTATVTIAVGAAAVNDSYTTAAGSLLSVSVGTGVLANDLGNGLTVKGVVAGPSHGSLILNANGSFSYTPAAGFSGIDTFTYNDTDSSGDTSNTATVTITVNPTAVNDAYTASAGSPLIVAASGVLGNDLGTGLTVKGVVAGPSHGSLTLNANGSFTYTPAAGFSGTDSFAYNDSDSSGDTSNTATVSITVDPTAVNDTYTASANGTLNVAGSGVLGNDLGTGLTVKGVVAGPSHGSLTLNANGSFTYTPAAGFSGTDSFAYNDSDSSGDTSNTATVTITVNPTAVNDVYTASAGSPLNVAASGVLGNDLGTGLTVKGVVAGPAHGSLTLNANGSFAYTPAAGFSGTDSFTYNDSDSSGDTSNTATVTITVNPTAVNDVYTASAGSPLNVAASGVLGNDLGTGLTVKGVVAGPSHGSLTLNANGSFTYTPAAGFSGTDSFTYNDSDSSGDTSNTATVTITVNPTAVNDVYTASAGSPLNVAASGVLGNDLGTGLTVKGVVAGPSHGSLTLNSNGSFAYTPAAGFSGTDSFAYNDSDSSGDTSNTATVTITVNPTAVNDVYTASAGSPLNVAASGVLGNDLGTGLTVKGVVAGPAHGSLTLNANGSFTYTPAAGFSGTDSFTYNDSDSSGDTSNTATVSITVNPTAVNDTYTASAGSPLNVAASGVLGNDLGTGLTVKGVVAGPSHGSLTLNSNGSFSYTPSAGFSGTDTFTYNDSDSSGDTSNTATVSITVNPTAVNDTYTASAGSPLNVAASGVLGNDLGTGLTVKGVVAGPAHGSLTLNANGSFTYTPAAGFSGTDTFAYNDSDSSGDTSNTATVTITVNPTAVNDVYTASAGSPLNVAASGVLGNDLGTGLTVKGVVAGPSHGSLTLNANGSFTYTPAAGFSGTDTFAYNDSDSSGDTSNTATVTITVNPTAVNDVYTASAGSPLNVAASGVLGNDLGTGLTVKGVVAGPAHGSLTLNSNGSFAYTPAAGFSGTDSFTYNDSDSSGDTSNTATVTITVNPTAVNDVYTASAGSPLNVAASGVLGNDLGTGLTVKGVVAGPAHGSLTLNSNGSFAYTPAAGFSGTDTFTYNDSDSSGDTSNTATVTITVNPTAVNDVYTASAGSPLNVAASGVLGNDLGTGLTVKGVVAGPSHGSLTLNSNGSFSYTPSAGFSGTDTFTYNDSDSSGDTSNTATVTITVAPSGTVTGLVYLDANRNGQLDSGEPGIGEVVVAAIDSTGTAVAAVTTDSGGNYGFESLRPGTYTIEETPLAGYGSSTPEFVPVSISANQNVTGVDFGNTLGSLSGTVYVDVNNNGTKDANEPGIPGVTLQLTGTDIRGVPVTETTVTSLTGTYTFADLLAGTYTITATAPANYSSGLPAVGTLGGTLGASLVSSIPVGASAMGFHYDFGERGPTLSGTVFQDTNRNGLLDPGEPGLANITVSLRDSTGDIVGFTQTGPDGSYLFNLATLGLPVGSYSVAQVQPAGYGTSTPSSASVSVPITGVTGVNFGDTLGSLGGFVYLDANHDGRREPTESGLSGVTVTLTGTTSTGSILNLTLVTNADGSYRFDQLPASNASGYTLTETTPAGYLAGQADAGTVNGSAVGVAGKTTISATVLGPGLQGLNFDFGNLIAKGQTFISGEVYDDQNANGILDAGEPGLAGVPIELRQGTTVLATLVTDSNGFYRFDHIVPGSYTLVEATPAPGFADSTPATIGPVKVGTSGVDNRDFGEASGQLGGVVYIDANNNGVQDPGEPGLPGVVIQLSGVDASGPVSSAVITGPDGAYTFTGLLPGTYAITETPPPGLDTGLATRGTINGTTIGIAGTGAITGITLGVGQIGVNYDFGERSSKLSGSVYLDANDNGQLDAGEPGISGVLLHLTGTDASNQLIDRATLTGADGSFSFDVPAGTYTITETPPAGYLDGTDQAGTAGGTPGTNVISTIDVATGAQATGYDFGELMQPGTGEVNGLVFLDSQPADGIREPGEPGEAGVTVKLLDAASNVVATTTTAPDGTFFFANVAPGTYTAAVTTPAGMGNSTPTSSMLTVAPGIVAAPAPFGLTLSSLSGSVFQDLNMNGTRDANDPGIAGVVVVLTGTDASGASVDLTATTDRNGDYVFANLLAGNYTITAPQNQPALARFYDGGVFAVRAGDRGYLDNNHDGTVDAGDTPLGIRNPANGNVLSGLVLGGGQQGIANNFDEVPPADPFGFVFEDRNDNGIFVPGDKGIANVQVTISGINALTGLPLAPSDIDFGNDDNLDGDNNPFTRRTDATGLWAFEVIPPGDYTITLTQPAGYFPGALQNGDPSLPAPTTGTTTKNGAVISEFFSGIVEAPAQVRGPFNFAELKPSTIGGIAFWDSSNNGVYQNGEMLATNVLITLTGVDDQGHRVTQTVNTNAVGAFAFTNLRPSDAAGYTITLTPPSGTKAGKTSGPSGSRNVGSVSHIVLGEAANLDFQLGILGDPVASKRNLLV